MIAAPRSTVAPLGPMLLAQTRAELRMRWRVPPFSLTSLALPIVFFTFFGLPVAGLTRPDGVSVGAFLVASFGAYAVGSVMVYSFGIGVAVERGMKADMLMRVMPVPAADHLLAKVLTALMFSLISLVALIAYGILAGGVSQPPLVWGEMILRLMVGSVPRASCRASCKGSPPYLPTFHYGQLVWGSLGASSEPLRVSLAWLAGYGVFFFAMALRAYRRDEQRKFG